ncbi:MAG: amino acid ABC transporter substrate-binding protein, partial [Nitrospirae bacterium]|nr:amino acid ABC transporter substrate-binding protein [Nitrospirota bacterium]
MRNSTGNEGTDMKECTVHSGKPLVNVFCAVSLLLITLVCISPAHGADKTSFSLPKGLSRGEAMRLGEAMYRDGRLPSGKYIQAVVEGDIPVEGSMFTCANCHMRSGLGSVEGTIISPATNGERLYRSRKGGQEFTDQQKEVLPAHFRKLDIRPAYTDKTLARAIRSGVGPGGRKLDPIMPRYELSGRDLQILVYYLKNLSSELSPGVTATTIRFATVVGEGVSPEERDAVVLPLETYVKDRNARVPYYKARAGYRLFAEEMDKSYRSLELLKWELKGPPGTWRSQLENYYKKEPVFALLGGIAEGSWLPVHEFCEQKRVPCILPATDQPVISDTDWYTLYFSKGPFQEGEAAARYLNSTHSAADRTPVVQVFRRTEEGVSISRGFRETWEKLGMRLTGEVALDPREEVTDSFWTKLAGQYRNGILVVWLGMEDLRRLAGQEEGNGPSMKIVSSTIIGPDLSMLPESLRPHTYIT